MNFIKDYIKRRRIRKLKEWLREHKKKDSEEITNWNEYLSKPLDPEMEEYIAKTVEKIKYRVNQSIERSFLGYKL